MNSENLSLKRILGIDQLRYIFALWVFFFHGGSPPLFKGHTETDILNFIERLSGWCINGQAAVIGFFILSGLCIHYPNIYKDKLDLKSFYTARLLRLSLPLLAVIAIGKMLDFNHAGGFMRVVPVWTLYCEAMYYLAYPLILLLVKKKYLIKSIIVSSIISVILLLVWNAERPMYFHEFDGGEINAWKATILALPVWLLGALIAERLTIHALVEKYQNEGINIWKWRIGALMLSALPLPLYRIGLYFHLLDSIIIGLFFTSQFTLLVFSIYAYMWIEREVICNNFGKTSLSPRMEKLGLASYSLYLVHIIVIWLCNKLPSQYFPGYMISWILLVIATHASMFVFYYLIEKPSHMIAKWSSKALRSV